MAAGNQVVLTFAGEEKQLTDSFNRVGAAAKDMDTKVHESADGFNRVGEAADEVDTKAMGFRDTLTGVQDTMGGLAKLSKGPSFEGFLTLGAGIGDLGSGFYNFLVPSMKAAMTALEGTKVATLATAAAEKIAAAGSKVWAAGQWLLNAALTANPIGLVVVAIGALIAIFVIAWKHSETFRNIVIGTWNGIKAAALAVGSWFRDTLWPWLKGVGDKIGDMFRKIPGAIKSAFSGLVNIILWPYRTAFNLIVDAWNNTIGRLSWTVPGWVPKYGGNTISAPTLPHFHAGGIVPGVYGEAVPIMAQAGETVSTAAGTPARSGAVYVRGDGLVDYLIEAIAGEVRRRGGDPGTLGLGVAGA